MCAETLQLVTSIKLALVYSQMRWCRCGSSLLRLGAEFLLFRTDALRLQGRRRRLCGTQSGSGRVRKQVVINYTKHKIKIRKASENGALDFASR